MFFFQSIWKRYFIKELVSCTLFFLICFWFLYIMIDMMSHIKIFLRSNAGCTTWIFYYCLMLIKRLDTLLPFALLIATIGTLSRLNARNELIALLVSGISVKKLLTPFIAVSIAMSSVLYLNYEFLYPHACAKINWIDDNYSKDFSSLSEDTPLQEILLKDGSKIIYRNYDSVHHCFYDVFWIRSTNELYHMKTLSTDLENPLGTFVDRLICSSSGRIEKESSFERKVLNTLKYDESSLQYSLIPPKEQSLSSLWWQLPQGRPPFSDKKAHVLSTFWYRILSPWVCLLVVIAAAPYCLQFSRNPSFLLVYLGGIASLFCFQLVVQASLTIAQSQATPVLATLLFPWCTLFFFFSKKYYKL